MPTLRDPGTLQSAKSFCDDFLNASGLSLVVNVLQRDAIPGDVDYETRQGCYAICLQLLRYIITRYTARDLSLTSASTYKDRIVNFSSLVNIF